MPTALVLGVIAAAVGWIAGEIFNKPWLRWFAGPLFSFLLTVIVAAATVVHCTFSDAQLYSSATKQFIAAVVEAIDRGDTESAHAELKRFDQESIETYEGGAFLRWLREPTERLNKKQD